MSIGVSVASWPGTQEVAERAKFKSFYCNDIFLSLNSLNSVKKHLGKTQLSLFEGFILGHSKVQDRKVIQTESTSFMTCDLCHITRNFNQSNVIIFMFETKSCPLNLSINLILLTKF